MERREFGRHLFAALGTLTLAPHPLLRTPLLAQIGPSPPESSDLRVRGERLNRTLEELSRFGKTPEGGVHRVAFSEADLQARRYVRGLMEEGGLATRIDAAGNLIGARSGRRDDLSPLLVGSHIDSVPDGGNYDGPVGSMAAVEVARVLHEEKIETRHPLEVVIFANEEGGKTGSRAMSGEVEPRELELPTASGKTIGEGLRFIGGEPDRLDEVRRTPEDVAAFLELHVEQGAILEEEGIDIGVVEGIVGIRRWNVEVQGFANHAGTTPMDARRDALVAAARFVDRVHRVAREIPGRHVATVGRIEAFPGAPNVIPGRTVLSLEIRDLEMATIDRIHARLQEEARELGRATDTRFTFEPFYLSRAAPTDEAFRDIVEESARKLGLSTLRMPSGAGHDAQSFASLAPLGMIFVPSVDGISHSPREHTSPEDVVNGANVLLRSLLEVDTLDLP